MRIGAQSIRLRDGFTAIVDAEGKGLLPPPRVGVVG
jgi:hypothetical protein